MTTGVPFVLPIQNWLQVAPLLIRQHMTWPLAQNYCKENHLDLFTIANLSSQVKLTEVLIRNNEIGPVWTGLYNDLDSWYWSYNHLPLKNISLRMWMSGQPDDGYGQDVCGTINTNGYWESLACYYTGPFLCYDGKPTC